MAHPRLTFAFHQALIKPDAMKHVTSAVTAVILFGTPHKGTKHIGYPEILQRIVRSGTTIKEDLVKSLHPGNEGNLDTELIRDQLLLHAVTNRHEAVLDEGYGSSNFRHIFIYL